MGGMRLLRNVGINFDICLVNISKISSNEASEGREGWSGSIKMLYTVDYVHKQRLVISFQITTPIVHLNDATDYLLLIHLHSSPMTIINFLQLRTLTHLRDQVPLSSHPCYNRGKNHADTHCTLLNPLP